MKKTYLCMTMMFLALSATACQNSAAPAQRESAVITEEPAVVENQLSDGILIAYPQSASQDSSGSLEEAGRMIEDVTDGVIFHMGGEDRKSEDYGTVFLGIPGPSSQDLESIQSCLESEELSGKTIIPFFADDGGKLEEVMEQLYEWAPETEFLDAIVLNDEDTSAMQAQVSEWLSELGYNK